MVRRSSRYFHNVELSKNFLTPCEALKKRHIPAAARDVGFHNSELGLSLIIQIIKQSLVSLRRRNRDPRYRTKSALLEKLFWLRVASVHVVLRSSGTRFIAALSGASFCSASCARHTLIVRNARSVTRETLRTEPKSAAMTQPAHRKLKVEFHKKSLRV